MAVKVSKTYHLIMETAMRLIDVHGFENVTIDQICAEADIARSTFYYHFNTKEDLAVAFFQFHAVLPPERMAFALSAKTPWERVLRMQTSFSVHTIKHNKGDLLVQYKKSCLNGQPDEDKEVRDYMKTIMKPLIIQAQDAGEIRNTSDPSDLCDVSSMLQRGISFEWAMRKFEFDLYDTVCRLMETFYDVVPDLRGLREEL